MTILRKHLGLLLVTVVLTSAAQQAAAPKALPGDSATVTDLKGEVRLYSPKGDAFTAKLGLVLDPETTIETGTGRILLNLADGSQVLLKPHSLIVLKSPRVGVGSYLELLMGKLTAKVQKHLQGTPPFRLGTPSAVITVRGTRFEVEVTKKKRTYVLVFEGLVEVRGLMTGSGSVLIPPGSSTEVDANQDPQTPREGTDHMRDSGGRSNDGQGRQGEGTGHENNRPEQDQTRQPQDQKTGGRPD